MDLEKWTEAEKKEMYEAIRCRKSTRSFKAESLPEEMLRKLQAQMDKKQPLFPNQKTAFRILDSTQVKGRVSDQAYYVAGYTDHGLENYANLGFMMEQLVLWLTSQNVATWWHGLINPVPEYAQAEGLPFAFMFTFGISDGEPLRNISEFNRKDTYQISDVSGIDALLEAVRLAPSGRNVQPWYITGSVNELKLFNDKENALIRKIAPDVEYINAGIALCHLWLAAQQDGKTAAFIRESGQKDRSKKLVYICTVRLSGEKE